MNTHICRVFVNEIEVGSIPHSDYRQIILEASQEIEKHFYLLAALQTINIATCLFQIFVRILKTVPVIATAAFLLCAYFESDQVAVFFSFFQSAKPADLAIVLKNLSSIVLGTTTILVIGHSIMVNNTFGFINQFDTKKEQVIGFRLRSLLEVSTEGTVRVQIAKA